MSSKKSLNNYKFPVYTTKLCPQNQNEWKERSSFFNCSGSSYMCFPNENFTELLEFCYNTNRTHITPSKKIMKYIYNYTQISNVSNRDKIIMLQTLKFGANLNNQLNQGYKINVYVFIKGTCMYLHGRYSVLNGYNCSGFTHGCPSSSYFSDEVYKCTFVFKCII